MKNELNFAVLIDADNIANKYIKIILDEVANNGIATYKRIYGDWTNPFLSSWKSVLLENSIVPIQQYGYTIGKSSTDSAMIIDAMDILYSGNVNGFCIVSSDSDFTRLAARLRESGMTVIGMGESKTPRPFIAACNQFKYLDILFSNAQPVEMISKVKETSKQKTEMEAHADSVDILTDLETIKKAIVTLVEEGSDEDGWIFSGDLGNQLAKRYADFDLRNFGFYKLTPFIKSLDLFEIKSVKQSPGANVKLVYIKLKQPEAKEQIKGKKQRG